MSAASSGVCEMEPLFDTIEADIHSVYPFRLLVQSLVNVRNRLVERGHSGLK